MIDCMSSQWSRATWSTKHHAIAVTEATMPPQTNNTKTAPALVLTMQSITLVHQAFHAIAVTEATMPPQTNNTKAPAPVLTSSRSPWSTKHMAFAVTEAMMLHQTNTKATLAPVLTMQTINLVHQAHHVCSDLGNDAMAPRELWVWRLHDLWGGHKNPNPLSPWMNQVCAMAPCEVWV